MDFVERLHHAQTELAQREADPFRRPVETIMSCLGDSVSTAALLDLLGMRNTTGNGRKIARTLRTLGFIPIKSRRLEPGGWRDTVTRGWVRPLRKLGRQTSLKEDVTAKPSHSNSSGNEQFQQKDTCYVL